MEEGVNVRSENKNKNIISQKRKVKQHILIAPQLLKVKDLLMKELARMLIYMNLIHLLLKVTGFMIFLIKGDKSLQKVQLFW